MTGILPWGAASSVVPVCRVGLGGRQPVSHGLSRRPPRPSGRRNGDERAGARVHHRFPLCSGRPSTGAATRAGDRDLAVATIQPQGRDGIHAGARLTFDTLGLSADLLRTVAEEGYTAPTPVQTAAIPLVLEGRDVLAAAQT